MPDFNVRSDSVNVEQIMEQIRARVREKRGVDYTEQQIRELAAVKLEKFLDPRGVRSDLLDQFRNTQPDPRPNYAFEEETLFETHRAPIRWIRRLLRPVLKLLFNPNPLIQALHIQAQLNTMNTEREAARHGLYFEVTQAPAVRAPEAECCPGVATVKVPSRCGAASIGNSTSRDELPLRRVHSESPECPR